MAEGIQYAKIAATAVNLILYVAVLVLNYSANDPTKGPFRHLFGNATPGGASDKFYLEITPAGWAFSIWGLIYLWQGAWIIYSLILLCRSHAPNVICSVLLVSFSLASVSNGSWVVVWSHEWIQTSSVLLFSISFFLYGALATSFRTLNLGTKGVNNKDFIATQVLVNNGVALYATWCTIASLLNLAMAITYYHGVEQDVASTISLAILAVEVIVWFSLENTILDKYVRYTLSIYPVVIWALSASINKNWNPAKRNSIISVILLALACVLLAARVVIVVWREKKKSKPSIETTFAIA